MLYQKDKEIEYINKSKIGLPNHLNTFQWDLIEGLDEILKKDFSLFNQLPFASYPKYKQLIFKTERFTNRSNCNDVNIGYINFFGLKQITKKRGYLKYILKFIENNNGEKICVLAYGLNLPTLKVIAALKKFNNVETAIIVPDLPMKYGILPHNTLKRIIYEIYGKIMLDLTKYVDKFVLFTDAMRIPLNIGDRPYVVVEGLVSYSPNRYNDYEKGIKNQDEKIILYTGSLSYVFGIKNLISAFSSIENKNLKLWICGFGEAEKELKELEKNDKRVTFFGFVTKDEVFRLQNLADIMINPRGIEGEYTKYSFPSKTLEYLKSGKPTIMCKLPGMPQEYYDHFYLMENNSVNTLISKILEVTSKSNSELEEMGRNSKKWVLENKNCYIQAKKIVELLSC